MVSVMISISLRICSIILALRMVFTGIFSYCIILEDACAIISRFEHYDCFNERVFR